MPFPVLGSNSAVAGYEIDNSLRFNYADSPRLTKSGTVAGSTTFTFSAWLKFTIVNNYNFIFCDGNEVGLAKNRTQNGGAFYLNNATGGTYTDSSGYQRDPSAWYHVVVSCNSGTGIIYVNNDNRKGSINIPQLASDINIGSLYPNPDYFMDGYMSEVHFVDGQALAPTEFGETNDNGVWIPKRYEGTYGTNGFFLEFKNSGSLGTDTSGNGNNFTATNLTATDQTTDTPTNNFCTWNPLVVRGGSDDLVYTEGNTGVSSNQHATNNYTFGTQGFANGKWYWEVECETVGGEMHIGIVDSGSSTTGYPSIYREYRNNGNKDTNTSSASSFGNTYTDGDIIGVAVDLDNTSIYFSKNGTWQNSGNPESGSSKTGAAFTDISSTNFSNFVLPWVAGGGVNGGADMKAFANFGNAPFSISSGNSDANGYGNFEYAVPSGYYSLCTKNLAEYG